MRISGVLLLVVSSLLLTFTSIPAHAGEAYTWQGRSGFSTSFSLIGGQYQVYLNAHYVPTWAQHRDCGFGADFQEVWPKHDSTSFGPVRLSTIHYNVGPKVITLEGGRYHFFVASSSNCQWRFTVVSDTQNSAGLAPVEVLTWDNAKQFISPAESVSLNQTAQFRAQYRTDHDAQAPASGQLQLIHDGKVYSTIPLLVGKDPETQASKFYINVEWGSRYAQQVGKNTAKFIVKIGNSQFTSSTDFTLAQ